MTVETPCHDSETRGKVWQLRATIRQINNLSSKMIIDVDTISECANEIKRICTEIKEG